MTRHYDVCVIGGGIQGVGVAQAAAAQGYKVVLLEKNALASATSSRSSKLIHGGLRYLESAQFRLVAESLYERELLLANAPELVKRVPFYIPVYTHSSRASWKIFSGLSLYAVLGRLKAAACFRRLERKDWDHLDGLTHDKLKTVYQYYDAQTDDVKLTRAVMYSACALEAELLCPAEFIGAEMIARNYRVQCRHAGEEIELTSSSLVNACGPWVSAVQQKIQPSIALPDIELVQGAHLVLNQPAPHAVYYVESPSDRRAVFVMPWYEHTLVGTTETLFNGDPASITATEHEVDYLRNIVRYYFPGYNEQVINSFAGVRVLPKSDSSMFNRSRDTVYFSDSKLPGYVAVMGGKLTGYRHSAHKVVQRLIPYLPDNVTKRADTKTLRIDPAPDNF